MMIVTPTSGIKTPPLSWVRLYFQDVRRMNPQWSLRDKCRHALNLAYEAFNPRHSFWW